jgi:hypothetical protein
MVPSVMVSSVGALLIAPVLLASASRRLTDAPRTSLL